MPSFYVPELKETDSTIKIESDEYHHIVKVFRHKVNDIINLNNGKGLLANGKISYIDKRLLVIDIQKRRRFLKKDPAISVYFSLLRNKNDHLLVEKLTELGVRKFYPFVCTRSVKKDVSTDKYQRIAVSAIKQCDNAWLPEINDVIGFNAIFEKDGNNNVEKVLLAATEREADTYLNNNYLSKAIPKEIGIIIGPEGGFTDTELYALKENNISLISLGQHILRAETAAICAVSQLLLIVNLHIPDYY